MKKIFYTSLVVLIILLMSFGAFAGEHYNGETGKDEIGSYSWEYLGGIGWIKNYGSSSGGVTDDGAADPTGDHIGYVDDGSGKVPDGLVEPTIKVPAFADVYDTDWFYSDMKEMYESGIIKGYEDGMLRPNNPVTRGKFVTLLGRYDKIDTASYSKAPFSDCPAKWYQESIAWAAKEKIVEGVGDNRYLPDTKISRQEMAAIINRYVIYRGFQKGVISYNPSFADDTKIADWAKDDVYSLGLLVGNEKNLMKPVSSTSRAETVAMLYRLKYFAGDGYKAP